MNNKKISPAGFNPDDNDLDGNVKHLEKIFLDLDQRVISQVIKFASWRTEYESRVCELESKMDDLTIDYEKRLLFLEEALKKASSNGKFEMKLD